MKIKLPTWDEMETSWREQHKAETMEKYGLDENGYSLWSAQRRRDALNAFRERKHYQQTKFRNRR